MLPIMEHRRRSVLWVSSTLLLAFTLTACSPPEVYLGDVSGQEFTNSAEVTEYLGCDSVVWADDLWPTSLSEEEAFPEIQNGLERNDGLIITAAAGAGDDVWLLLDEDNRVWGAASPGSVQYCLPGG
jgi:hypothetical protein